ncbi:hypothetical protein [Cellulomonas alba]|uniref:Uncharacterized protein n=1 Tax=Cellulomonas alba TaxID=3053467 RepID=A0ABT7SFF5_9CELL|nr:hypothetical protein [Cellulomonas alba]MDM7854921.1 hypothetical protein [Cellulomonas alba]
MTVLRRIVGFATVGVFVIIAGVLAAFGVSVGSALLVGAVAAGAVLLFQRLDQPADPDFEHLRVDHRDGARGDLQELTWAMVARDGRVGERVLRRIRLVAAGRLARHGLTLGEAADEAVIRALLGDRAYETLTRLRSPLPSIADVRHTVDLLDHLGPNPGRTS